MTGEIAKQIITFVLKRIGKNEISESDFYLTMSMRLQWCSPNIAQQFMKRCIQEGLLIKNGGMISTGFSISAVSLPLGFKPTSDFFELYTPKQSSLDLDEKSDIYAIIEAESSISLEDIQSAIEIIMKEKCVEKQVALLLFAKIHDIDISSFIPHK